MSEQKDFNLSTFFPYQVRMFYHSVSQTIKAVYNLKYGLSVDEWRTMANLYEYEPLSAKQIVKRSSIGKVNVSRAIASLQKKNYLERHIDPTDRRRVLLRLTLQGKNVMKELLPLLQETEQEILSGLTEKEHLTLLSLMEKVQVAAPAPAPVADSENSDLDD